MKHILLFLSLTILTWFATCNSLIAQRFAYVDTEYILENVPEYESAREELRHAAETWRDEIRKKREEIAELRRDYEAEKVLLPEEIREERRKELKSKEKELEAFRESKFGPNGELYQKRDRLLQPIQDRIFDAIQEVARDAALDFVFDRAGDVTMLYYSVQYDRSDEVLNKMGIEPPDEREEAPERREPPDKRKEPERKDIRPERQINPDNGLELPDGFEEMPENENLRPVRPD